MDTAIIGHDAPFMGADVVHITRRKDPNRTGEWRYQIHYTHDGERWFIYSDPHRGTPLASRKAVDQLKAVIELEIDRGDHNPLRYQPASKRRWRFDFIIRKWLEGVERMVAQGQRSAGTLRAYRTYVEYYLIPHFGDQDVTEIKKHHITGLVEALPELKRKVLELEISRGRRRNPKITDADLEMAPKTMKHILLVLATFLNYCVDQEILLRAPSMPAIRVPRRSPRWTDQETQYRVLAFVPEKHRDFAEFNILHGFRQGEACDLRVKDVSLGGTPAIRLHHKKTGVTHYVPMHPKAVDMVARKCQGKLPEGHIFSYVDEAGIPRAYTVGRLFRVTKAALIKAGLDLTPYELFKHSKLTQAAQNGASSDEITAYAGWASKAMADVYINNDVRNLAKLHEKAEVVEIKKKEGKAE